jgi:Trypsin-co-occurring domain 1
MAKGIAVPISLPNGARLDVLTSEVTWPEIAESDAAGEAEIAGLLTPQGTLNEIRDAISGVAATMQEAFKAIRPSEATIEFGIDIGVESGTLTALLVKGTGQTHLKVTLKWSD